MVNGVLTMFPAEHPAFPGHFPGAPVVPGVLLLDELVRALATELRQPYTAFVVQSVKFLHAVRPGERVFWRYTKTPAGSLQMTLSVDDCDVATAVLAVESSA